MPTCDQVDTGGFKEAIVDVHYLHSGDGEYGVYALRHKLLYNGVSAGHFRQSLLPFALGIWANWA